MQRLPKALNLEKQLLLSNLQTLTLTRTIKRARLPIVITATAAEKSQTLALERLKRENLAQETIAVMFRKSLYRPCSIKS